MEFPLMKWRPSPRYFSVLAAALVLPTAARHANAQAIEPEDNPSWKFAIGAGGISAPRYPGSSKRQIQAIPLLSASYGRYFIGGLPGAGVPVGLGMNIIESPEWKFGIGLGIDLKKPRKESDDARLTGLGDISGTPHGAVFGSYTHDWLSLRGNVVTDIGGKHEGTLASLELEGKYNVTPSLTLSAGPGLVWADKKYTQTFFGIDAAQSANSGLAPFAAGAGLNMLRFSVGAEYRFDKHWFMGARATAGTLRGDARHSPITSDTSQNTFGIFGGYHF
jgi:outer membrane protein